MEMVAPLESAEVPEVLEDNEAALEGEVELVTLLVVLEEGVKADEAAVETTDGVLDGDKHTLSDVVLQG